MGQQTSRGYKLDQTGQETQDLLDKIEGVEAHAQVNIIESVKVNGTAMTPDANKAVDVEVPTALSELSDDATHRLVTDAEKDSWNDKQAAINRVNVTVSSGSGTPSGSASMSGNTLNLSFTNLKGDQGETGPAGPTGATGATGPQGETGPQGPAGSTGAAAGFGTPTASINSGTGTPSVSVSASGPDTAKVFNFTFSNLKGAKGDTGETGATGPQGPQGDTGATGEQGVGISTVTSAQDGTIVITLTNGDEITVDLNHVHPQYENIDNKVTSLSSASTDSQYPSAKCVYDLVGDIETLLAAL